MLSWSGETLIKHTAPGGPTKKSYTNHYIQGSLPPDFDRFFNLINSKHLHETRLAYTFNYSLPLVRTNYGMFSIKFSGPRIWNSLDESLKVSNKYSFKKKYKEQLIGLY